MKDKACPVCKSTSFYVKSPHDAFEVFEFHFGAGGFVLDPEEDVDQAPAVDGETETYCTRCAWHDKFASL